jgi:hypothetical protein
MSKIQVEYFQCDSCAKQIIAIDLVKAKWIMVQGDGSLYFIDKKGDVQNKQLGHYCSKKCFYDLVKEEIDKADEAPPIVDRNDIVIMNIDNSEEF